MYRFFTFAIFCTLSSCGGSSVPDGHIMVRNDSMDREFNVIEVSGAGRRFTLKPHQEALFPPGTRTLHLSRRYADYTRRYTVNCPGNNKDGLFMRLIDVHLNRLPGGCKTVEADK